MPTIHTYLFLKTDFGIFVKFDNIDKWTANNYMVVSLVKTKDTVFHQTSARSTLPVAVIATEQTVSTKLLGVTFIVIFSLISMLRPAWVAFSQLSWVLRLLPLFAKLFGLQQWVKKSLLLSVADKITTNNNHCIHKLLTPTKVLATKLYSSQCIFCFASMPLILYKSWFVLCNLFDIA